MTSKQSSPATVSIQRSTYDTLDLESLLRPLGGITAYIKKGDVVLLKVNLLNATPPERAVVTNPQLVRRTAEMVLAAGATPVIGDSPGGPYTKRRLQRVYQNAGLVQVSRDLGVDLNYDTRTTTVPVPDGRRLKTTPLCTNVLDADAVIALPKIKTHSFMIMTLATKIMFGAVPGLTKAKYHAMFPTRPMFSDMLLDVLSVVPPDLFIMDGIIGMEGEGPSAGTPVQLGTLLASDDPLAMDLSVCRMLHIEPIGIPILKRARLRSLWPASVTYPLLTPEDVAHPGFVLPQTAGYLLTGKKQPKKHPTVTGQCTGCGQCAEICPKHAITTATGKAAVDLDTCIRCYCCQEICPEKAIVLTDQDT